MTSAAPSALAGRHALVTGASGGVGSAVSRDLVAQGATVVCVARDATRLRPLLDEARGRARSEIADLSDGEALARLIDRIAAESFDILVNNAGHDRGGNVRFDRQHPQDVSDKFAVNVVAAMRLTGALLPRLLARGPADIVNIGSAATRASSPGLTSYGATKHALHGFSEGLRADFADTDLRITEIIPGVIRSGFAARRWDGDEARAETFYAGFAACLEPDDVARAVVWALTQPAHVSVDEIVLQPTRRNRPTSRNEPTRGNP